MTGKFLLAAFLIFYFSFGVFYFAFASTIFSDGLESDFSGWTGNDPKWETSGGNIHGGAKRGEVKGNTEPGDDVLLKVITTEGYENITLNFWYRIYKGLEEEDHVYVEWTGDGLSWGLLNDFTALGDSMIWELASYNLPAGANDKSNFAIRFRAHLSAVTSDIFYLDDVVLLGDSQGLGSTPNPTPDLISTPTPAPTPDPTLTPTVTPTPSTDGRSTPSPIPTKTPTPSPTKTPTLLSVITKISSPQPTASQALVVTKTPASSASLNTSVKKATPSPSVLSDNSIDNNLTEEVGLTEEPQIPSTLSASISNFFNGSKSIWLIGLMVLTVVFSLAKLKKD